jgi:hypothetical protein
MCGMATPVFLGHDMNCQLLAVDCVSLNLLMILNDVKDEMSTSGSLIS